MLRIAPSHPCVSAQPTAEARQRLFYQPTLSELSHSSESEKVDHLEISGNLAVSLRQYRSPTRFIGQKRLTVELKKPDDDFSHEWKDRF